MEAKELRIGNWVWNDVQDLAFQVDGNLISLYYSREKCGFKDTLPIGIPLTEEWLLKFGGEEVGIDMYGVKRYDFNRLNIGYKEHFFIDDEMPTDVVIKYVHQLQNIYFALTGKELEIKEYD